MTKLNQITFSACGFLLIVLNFGMCNELYDVKIIKLIDDDPCLYQSTTCKELVRSLRKIPEKYVPTGTMTLSWKLTSGIGQDYYTANQMAIKEAGKNGADLILLLSGTEFKDTKLIADMTYRMYSKPCKIVPETKEQNRTNCIETEITNETRYLSGRDWNSNLIYILKPGTKICIYEFGFNNFWKVSINGRIGYVHNTDIKETEESKQIYDEYWSKHKPE